MGKTFSRLMLPACAMLYQKISPDAASAVFFGEHVTSFSIQNASFFDLENIKNMPLENATNIAGGYEKAMEIAFRDKDNIERENESKIFDKVLSDYEVTPIQ